MQIADRIWLMDKNQGLTVGTPEDLALDGSLCRFFHRKGVHFNEERGIFEVAYEYAEQIQIEGEGQRRAMVEKALRRNGIQCVTKEATEWRVTVEPDSFLLAKADATAQRFSTIDQLLKTYITYIQRIRKDKI